MNEHKHKPIVRCQSLLALHNQLTSRRTEVDVRVNRIYNLLSYDGGGGDSILTAAEEIANMYNDLCEEIIHLSVYEPGLRYWMQKSWPFAVWVSTLDEIEGRKGLTYCDSKAPEIQEIDFTDYQELRKQEYARLTPTVPTTTEETPNEEINKN